MANTQRFYGETEHQIMLEKANLPQGAVQSQTTGSIFSTLWTILAGESFRGTDNDTSARAYIDELHKARNSEEAKLLDYLISLRVHLSTVKLDWIEIFISEGGMNAIDDLLFSLTKTAGEKKVLTDGESRVLLELVRCLRILLNTQVRRTCLWKSFQAQLASARV